MMLALAFITVLFLGDVVWALVAEWAGTAMHRFAYLRRKVTGGLLIASGLGLALVRTER